MIHGGARTAEEADSALDRAACMDSIQGILAQGRELLATGGSALQAVERCASLLEDDPLFNAGRGSVLNEHGKVEMDAAIMDGCDLSAGVYADNASYAVSTTGHGEDFMRTVLAKAIAGFIELQGHDAARAASAGIDYLVRKVSGRGGVIVIDAAGRCASRFTPGQMLHGWIERGGTAVCTCVDEKH